MQPIYVVAGGNHVRIIVDAAETDGAYDIVEVVAQPGGGPPTHQHAFAEWFHVLEGELDLLGERDGEIVLVKRLRAGDSAYVAPWEWHGTVNAGQVETRFTARGRPGVMSTYFAQAGVSVPDEHAAPAVAPPGPAQLQALAAAFDIRFWSAGGRP